MRRWASRASRAHTTCTRAACCSSLEVPSRAGQEREAGGRWDETGGGLIGRPAKIPRSQGWGQRHDFQGHQWQQWHQQWVADLPQDSWIHANGTWRPLPSSCLCSFMICGCCLFLHSPAFARLQGPAPDNHLTPGRSTSNVPLSSLPPAKCLWALKLRSLILFTSDILALPLHCMQMDGHCIPRISISWEF